MKNANDIQHTSQHLSKVADQIASYAMDIKDGFVSEEVTDFYEDMLLDQISQAQILMLKLTDLVTESQSENADGDGSVFAEGELTSVVGKPEQDDDSEEKEV